MLPRTILTATLMLMLSACGGGGGGDAPASTPAENSEDPVETAPETAVDITNTIFTDTSGDCSAYENTYTATAQDIQRTQFFTAAVAVTVTDSHCLLTANNIPNHDFNDATAAFATPVSEVNRSFSIPRDPVAAATTSPITQGSWDAVMRNGVVLDLLSAGCYKPTDAMADADGNVPVGCTAADGWLLDPLGPVMFGTDANNAHTQPDGTYHYHGNPRAMFDDMPGLLGSPVIGFAADGFPVYGSFFFDGSTVRKAVSGYDLRIGTRPARDNDNPGGTYDGTYIEDYEFTGAGDLDECNGMTVAGQYGYYVTDTYPWVMACLRGTPDTSFSK